jgi:dTDP-4-dehydrorhamnose reductase
VRLAVAGAGGGVGRAFLAQVPAHHDVHAFSHEELDIGEHHAVMRSIAPLRPDAILNFAAYTDVDGCESDPDRAYRDNAVGPQNLALVARACGAVLLHVSTDYVFDGEKGSPYDELDAPNPRSVYARSKLGGEELVRRVTPEHIIVRTGFVFGGGKDYLSGAIARMAVGDPAGGIADRISSPTFVRHFAARILPLLLTGRFGTYHVVGPEATTWFDVLQRAKRIGDLPGDVLAQKAYDLRLPAQRPSNSSLTSVLSADLGLEPMPALDLALAELLGTLGSERPGTRAGR